MYCYVCLQRVPVKHYLHVNVSISLQDVVCDVHFPQSAPSLTSARTRSAQTQKNVLLFNRNKKEQYDCMRVFNFLDLPYLSTYTTVQRRVVLLVAGSSTTASVLMYVSPETPSTKTENKSVQSPPQSTSHTYLSRRRYAYPSSTHTAPVPRPQGLALPLSTAPMRPSALLLSRHIVH